MPITDKYQPDYDNEDRIKRDIEHLKEWSKKQPHLRVRLDDVWLRAFIVGSKMNLEKAKQKLDQVYTLRTMSPEYYTGRDPMHPTVQEVLDRGTLLYLQDKTDPTYPAVVFMRAGLWEPSTMQRVDVARCHLMIVDVIILQLAITNRLKNGVIIVADLKDLRPEHSNPPATVRKHTKLLSCLSARILAVHALHKPKLFYAAWEIIKLIIPASKRERLSDANSFEDLFKKIPKRLFPKEYGGENGTVAELTAEMKRKVESYRDWLLEEEKYGCDEKLRPGKPKTYEDVFGLEGSFRQLSID